MRSWYMKLSDYMMVGECLRKLNSVGGPVNKVPPPPPPPPPQGFSSGIALTGM